MANPLIRYQETGDLHFVTFSCYHRRPYLGSSSAKCLFERSLETMRLRYDFFVTGYVAGCPTHKPSWVPHSCAQRMGGVKYNPKCYPQPMQVTLTIPDDLAAQLTAAGKDPARAALEALAVEGYRTQRLTEAEVKRMLDYGTRMQVHALLKEHHVDLNYSMDDLQQDIAASNRFLAQRANQESQAR